MVKVFKCMSYAFEKLKEIYQVLCYLIEKEFIGFDCVDCSIIAVSTSANDSFMLVVTKVRRNNYLDI